MDMEDTIHSGAAGPRAPNRIVVGAALMTLVLGAIAPAAAEAQEVLPFPPTPSASTAGLTMKDSIHQKRTTPARLQPGAPNILIVLIDDHGPHHVTKEWADRYNDHRAAFRKENQGMKPILGITHATVYRDPAKPDRTTVAQKQIYASRYYEGSLTVTSIVDAGAVGGRPAVYVLFFNRSRSDLLRGFGGAVKRKLAQSEVVKGTEYTLGGMRDALEKAAGVR